MPEKNDNRENKPAVKIWERIKKYFNPVRYTFFYIFPKISNRQDTFLSMVVIHLKIFATATVS